MGGAPPKGGAPPMGGAPPKGGAPPTGGLIIGGVPPKLCPPLLTVGKPPSATGGRAPPLMGGALPVPLAGKFDVPPFNGATKCPPDAVIPPYAPPVPSWSPVLPLPVPELHA